MTVETQDNSAQEEVEVTTDNSRSAQRRRIFKALKEQGYLGHNEKDGFHLLLASRDKTSFGVLPLEIIEGYSMLAVAASYYADDKKELTRISANQATKRAFDAGLLTDEQYKARLL